MLPRLLYTYHPKSFATLEIAEAAKGRCDLLWIVDRAILPEGADGLTRLLARLGGGVHATGLDPEAPAARVAEHRPDAMASLADSLLERAADIARRLSLPFHSPETA